MRRRAKIDRYGASTVDLAIGYIEAKVGGPVEGKPPVRFEALGIPVRRGGKVRELSLDEIRVDEIAGA